MRAMVLAVAAVVLTDAGAHDRGARSTGAGDEAALADYLTRAIGDDGRMRYKAHPAVEVTDHRYNVLRHAGALYALASWQHVCPQPHVAEALRRGADYLVRCCVAGLPGRPELQAVWSSPEITGTRVLKAKLGGAGLGLLALSEIEILSPGSVRYSLLEGLGRFILYMQKHDGDFHSRYIPSQGGRDDGWRSLYYPGEAALGLLALYDLTATRRWLDGALDALHFLARSRAGMDRPPPDHWALIATERLLRVTSDTQGRTDVELLRGHVERIARAMLDEHDALAPWDAGPFTADGRTTPAATRIEGLLAAERVLAGRNATLSARLRDAIGRGTQFLRGARVRSGALAGGMPRAVRQLPVDGTPERDRFNRRAAEVRIDYVQHALAALLGQASRKAGAETTGREPRPCPRGRLDRSGPR